MNYNDLWQRLTQVYDADEAKAVVRWVLDVGFGLTTTDIYCGKMEALNETDRQRLEAMMLRLEEAEPVQYVLGVADFCGRQFHVAPGVLIPRPETEELCRWIFSHGDRSAVRFRTNRTALLSPCEILDVGTGSGCIAITLALDIADSKVTAWDISDEALRIASENARRLGADITSEKRDALDPSLFTSHNSLFTTIVSNPPYIDEATERVTMSRNVLNYEPHIALFGPKDEPDLFYRRIGEYAIHALRPGGQLYFELNPLTAQPVADYLRSLGFGEVEIRQDQFGKNRFLKATKI